MSHDAPRTAAGLDRRRVQEIHRAETERYLRDHPTSLRLAQASEPHFLFGLPMHWMADWPVPVPLHVRHAQGSEVECADGWRHVDFCLGDTAAMFGHSPPPVARALAQQALQGLSSMLPSMLTPEVGRLLAERFGLPRWQVTLSASDANRFALRWARAVTGRPKVLVFDGCYHGTVDDTLVDLDADGTTVRRASLLGQVHAATATTVAVPFNDIDAVEQALAVGDVACLLCEPALTNCGLVLPRPGFMEAVQAACRRHGVIFILDETHTLSAGPGGYARQSGLAPDMLVLGKAVAGGLPAAVYGFTEALAHRMEQARRDAPAGHSGIGTTLSANMLTMAALAASLAEVITPEAYERMLGEARALEQALQALVQRHALPWCVTRLGARMELQFCTQPPANAAQARAAMDDELERSLHLYLLNRRVLITPFHNMLLVAPTTGPRHRAALLSALEDFIVQCRQVRAAL